MMNFLRIVTSCALLALYATAQSPANIAALKGLAPVSVLPGTDAGRAALSANYTVTGGIQTGAIPQPTLLPFAAQQQQALRDTFSGARNLAELSDGLGTTLGAAYLARAHYIDRGNATSLSQAVADVIERAYKTTRSDSNAGKFFFANATTDGKTPVSDEALAILKTMGGTTDVFGKSYGLPAGSSGADAYGNSRPFQTQPNVTRIFGFDYFNSPADNWVYNRGPIMDLTNSPSFPSGHTIYGYTGALTLAILVPERYQQMIARGAEYGNNRIIMGAHYAMDVLGGRAVALHGMAHLLANDPAYAAKDDFRAAVKKARAEMVQALEAACGNKIEVCAREDTGRLSNPAANEAFYSSTQTYNLPIVYPKNAGVVKDVGEFAPEAGYLLTVAFPSLTLAQANRILTETEGPGGGFLDNGSAFGIYSRLDLYAAGKRAAQAALASGSGK